MSRYFLEISTLGYHSLKSIKNPKLRRRVVQTIENLKQNPLQGKQLHGLLQNLYSIRTAENKFRIIYKIDMKNKLVSVLIVGERKPGSKDDIYALATRLIKILLS